MSGNEWMMTPLGLVVLALGKAKEHQLNKQDSILQMLEPRPMTRPRTLMICPLHLSLILTGLSLKVVISEAEASLLLTRLLS